MTKPTFAERFRYWFDGWMSRGTIALMVLLGIATVLLVVVVGGITVLVLAIMPDKYNQFDDDFTPWDVFWGGLMRTLDPGTMGGDQGWLFRILMLVITIGGLILVASLIGIVSGAFDAKVEELRKGRSRVLEKDHTLILGWSPKVFAILHELRQANESRGRSVVVVLASHDKVEMEDAIRAEVGATGRMKVICRTGDPMSLTDLDIANPNEARSIIVLAPEGSADPDSDVLKATLALTNSPRRRAEPYHIVGELADSARLDAARLVGGDEAHWVFGDELIGRITVQSCRQSGLSVVFSELLNFDGVEIYFSDQPSLHGMTYFETQLAFVDSCVIGMVKNGAVHLNPRESATYDPGDLLIVISEDDSTVRVSEPGVPDAAAVSTIPRAAPAPERTLVLGYNSALPAMLRELNDYVAPGSAVVVLADVKNPRLPDCSNLAIEFRRGDSTSRAMLDDLGVDTFDHIIVLAYKDTLDTQRADGKTLFTLLQLRDMENSLGVDLSIVSEMLDDRNREIAEVTNADDFIVSDKIISLMLSQVAENRQLTEVFGQLFASTGNEIYLHPASSYVQPGSETTFYTVLEAARRRGETAIGYRLDEFAHASDRHYGVVLNPHKAESVVLRDNDKVIVVAEG